MELAGKITKLRRQKGWSQEMLAEQMEISRQSVSKWELGTAIPELDKIIKLSELFGVSTDYLLKDGEDDYPEAYMEEEWEDNGRDTETDVPAHREKAPKQIKVSKQMALTFMDTSREIASSLGIAIALCVFSPVCLLVMEGISEMGVLSENSAGGIGVGILLLCIAIGVFLMIYQDGRLSEYEFMEKENFLLEAGVKEIVLSRKKEYAEISWKYISAGVALCILGVIPLVVAGCMDVGDYILSFCIAIMLSFIAIAVYAFVCSSTVAESFEKLLQEREFTPENKYVKKKMEYYPAVYWCIVTAVFLACNFFMEAWGSSWFIWPVAGVLFVAIGGIIKSIIKK